MARETWPAMLMMTSSPAPAAGRPPRASGSPPAGPPGSIPWRRCGRSKIRAAMPQFGGCRRLVMAPNLRIALWMHQRLGGERLHLRLLLTPGQVGIVLLGQLRLLCGLVPFAGATTSAGAAAFILSAIISSRPAEPVRLIASAKGSPFVALSHQSGALPSCYPSRRFAPGIALARRTGPRRDPHVR